MGKGNCRGFTLIELLVVIAIVAILAAILFPIFVQAKKRGIMMTCMGNLRQLSTAFRMYANNNNGVLPKLEPWFDYSSSALPPDPSTWTSVYPANWCGAVYREKSDLGLCCWINKGSLFPYTKNTKIYLCPADVKVKAEHVLNMPRDYPLSYSANASLDRANPDLSRKRASRMLLLIHEGRDTINDGALYWTNHGDDMPSKVHYEGSTISFVDGHAAYLNYNELMARRGTQEWAL